MSVKKIIVYIFFLLSGSGLFAQVNDARLWASVNIEKKITSSFSFTISEEIRMNENISEVGSFFTDAGFRYKINKLIRISANYRFTNNRQLDNSYSQRHRYYFDLSLRKKIKPVTFTFRTRFQSQYTDINCSPDWQVPEYYTRNKLTMDFDLDKKYSPFISAEAYTPLFSGNGLYIDNVRYCAGFDYQFNRAHEIELFYMLQKEYNVNNPQNDYIVGIGYYFTF